MNLQAAFLLFLTFWTNIAFGANILAILDTASPSHHIWNSPLLITLVNRGHNVTVLSPKAQKVPVTNLTDIVLEGLLEHMAGNYSYEEIASLPAYSEVPLICEWYGQSCEYSLGTKGMQQLMSYPDDMKFDLAIIEGDGGECLLGLINKFGSPPIVAVNGFSSPQWIHDMVGNPDNPAYVSSMFLPYTTRMSLLQRTSNVLFYLYMQYYRYIYYMPEMDRLAHQYFGSSGPLPSEIVRNISVMMTSTHHSFDYPRPNVPAMVSIAGIHIKQPQQLPQDLQNYLDEAKDGVIFFSLGTNLRSDKLTTDKRQALLEAFAELPQKVLWKWESDSLPGQPENVKLSKWMPQSDILAHPNVRLFITHSGLLSTQEAIYRGVPVIGIPFFGDQHINIQKMVDHGVGIKLNYKTLTKDNILTAIKAILNDASYKQNIQELSSRFRDQPETPLERAIYWCEYVMRHNGAHHLRSAALDLSWYEYLLLDVILLFLAGLLFHILLMYVCVQNWLSRKQGIKKIKQN